MFRNLILFIFGVFLSTYSIAAIDYSKLKTKPVAKPPITAPEKSVDPCGYASSVRGAVSALLIRAAGELKARVSAPRTGIKVRAGSTWLAAAVFVAGLVYDAYEFVTRK